MLVGAAEGEQRVDGLAGVDIADVAGVFFQRAFELEPDALEAHRRALRVFARDALPELQHLRAVGAGGPGARLGDLLEPRRRGEAADPRDEVDGPGPPVGPPGKVARGRGGPAP